MSIKREQWMLSIVAVVGLIATSPAPSAAKEETDILTTAARAGSFRTLVTALVAADLTGPLEHEGPFTVFAPTDEAFAKLPEGTLETLLKPENRDRLKALLTYHVVPNGIQIADHPPRRPLKKTTTLNGKEVRFERKGRTVRVNDSLVIQRNIGCTNGVIQVIDSVLMPPSNDVLAVADQAGTFKTLLTAVKAAELQEALKGEGPFTVFAPTDEAFTKLPKSLLQSLLKPENQSALQEILKYHVVAGRITARQAFQAGEAKTLLGKSVKIDLVKGRLQINDSIVTDTDLETDNGLIHVIDRVLIPPGFNPESLAAAEMPTRPGLIKIDADHNDRVHKVGLRADVIEINVGGAGNVTLLDIEADLIKVDSGGGSTVTITGQANRLISDIAGGALYLGLGLQTKTANVKANGGSEIELNVTDELVLNASAGATIRFRGGATVVKNRFSEYSTLTRLAENH